MRIDGIVSAAFGPMKEICWINMLAAVGYILIICILTVSLLYTVLLLS